MKPSIIASGILAASLVQGIAFAQVYDLPEPDAGVASMAHQPEVYFADGEGQFAGSLRLGPISRKTDGSQFRVILVEGARLRRLDLRVSFGKARIREAWLVMESGNKIPVQRFEATGLLESASLTSSENFSLNENVTEILIFAEGFTDDAELFLTALGDNSIPRLSVWHPPMSAAPNYGVGTSGDNSVSAIEKKDANCIQGYCVGNIVIFQRQRAKITKVYSDGRLGLLQRGTRKILTSVSEVRRPVDID
jgi:hypothetical protein